MATNTSTNTSTNTNIILDDPCSYSFKDLYVAANFSSTDSNEFQKSTKKSIEQTIEIDMWYASLLLLSQPEINNIVKSLCRKSGWYWKDMVENEIVFTSFSPKIKQSQETR